MFMKTSNFLRPMLESNLKTERDESRNRCRKLKWSTPENTIRHSCPVVSNSVWPWLAPW